MIRYIHRNPVKRGLVEKPEDWPWSSFRHYATGVQGTVEIEPQWTAFGRGNQLPQGVRLKEGERFGFPTLSTKNQKAWCTTSQRRPLNEFENESPARSSQKTR